MNLWRKVNFLFLFLIFVSFWVLVSIWTWAFVGIHGAEHEKEEGVNGTEDHPEMPITTKSSQASKGKAVACKASKSSMAASKLKREGNKNKK